jgi:hypothetical protein
MTVAQFRASLQSTTPPPTLSKLLQSLWYDGKGNWEMAHNIAQEIHTEKGSWIHAYLHRKEGDKGNASYWYHMANKPFPTVSLEQEWEQLVAAFLERSEVRQNEGISGAA